jgi:hypothetical protein
LVEQAKAVLRFGVTTAGGAPVALQSFHVRLSYSEAWVAFFKEQAQRKLRFRGLDQNVRFRFSCVSSPLQQH